MRLLLLAICAGLASTLAAATFNVANTNDSGVGSLRQAMIDAEAAAGADDITFTPTLKGTINLLTALPDVTQDLAIVGPASDGVIVQRSATALTDFRIFTATTGDLTLEHLWILNGRATGVTGGGAGEGGCIAAFSADLVVRHCVVSGGIARGGDATSTSGGLAAGGGIFAQVTLTLEDVLIQNCIARGGNTSDAASTGGTGEGGGVAVGGGSKIILRCRIHGCTAQAGTNTTTASLGGTAQGCGMIAFNSGLVVQDTDVADCIALPAPGIAAGPAVVLSCPTTMRRCAIRGTTGAAGLTTGASPVLIENCTISGNAGGAFGGLESTSSGTVTLSYCTITGNSASAGVGGLLRTSGTLQVQGCIVAGNTGTSPDVSGTFVDQGENLIGDATGSASFTTSVLVGDTLNPINAGLGSIRSFGGFIMGHEPVFGSFAVDAGGAGAPLVDQRGANRSVGGVADIGAIEFIPNVAPGFTAGSTVSTSSGNTVTVPGWATNINAGAFWESGQTLTFVLVGSTGLFRDAPSIDPITGDLTFRSERDVHATVVFNVYLVDDGGNSGGGSDSSASSLLVIQLNVGGGKNNDDTLCSTGTGTGGPLPLAGGLALLLLAARHKRRRKPALAR